MNAYVKLIRPFTIIPPFLVGVIGALIGALMYCANIDIVKIIFACTSLALCQAIGQIDNQLTDPPELDLMNNKNRPLATGEITKKDAEYLMLALVATAIFLAYLTQNKIFEWSIFTLLIGIYLYDHEPIRLKKRFLLNNFILAITRGFIPFIATTTLFAPLNETIILLAIGISIWVFFWQTTKDIPDVEGDKKFGIKTVPVVLGEEFTKVFIVIGSLIFLLYLVIIKEYFLFILFIPLITHGLYNLTDKCKGENIYGWKVFYWGIVLYYLALLIEVLL